ncbi:hypothetical protein P153DRAFT_48983 [Dothidotthia symphoricarpi CBS 119687]|uniref:Uncharacterized protein n=1 Tax=Dothidotthia symphoricarpi CBS 119687 TaxID=1392245 RepID=A0A6A6A9B8_9PLEO|nr:uncharacterized protein P153DRAFT_48983 [Dothidotthia symphoricarpi CBS 119687]KAF2128146.1 hypothetical protein P153DRAFT_48983 [Dothidotthia symphoricarpi CBS 119687]
MTTSCRTLPSLCLPIEPLSMLLSQQSGCHDPSVCSQPPQTETGYARILPRRHRDMYLKQKRKATTYAQIFHVVSVVERWSRHPARNHLLLASLCIISPHMPLNLPLHHSAIRLVFQSAVAWMSPASSQDLRFQCSNTHATSVFESLHYH